MPLCGALVAAAAAALSDPPTGALPDLQRARAKVPRPAYRGATFGAMAGALNAHLRRAHRGRTRPCAEWTAAQLQQVQRELFRVRDPALDAVYASADDSRALRAGGLGAHRAAWAAVGDAAAGTARLRDMQRDAHCHETVMWFAHHLPHQARLQAGHLELPLLPLTKWHQPSPAEGTGAAFVWNESYSKGVICLNCHGTGDAAVAAPPASEGPPAPLWPDRFSTQFFYHVRQWPGWTSAGAMYWDHPGQRHKVQYNNFCEPHYQFKTLNFTCSYMFVGTGPETGDCYLQYENYPDPNNTNGCCKTWIKLPVINNAWLRNTNTTFVGQEMIDGVLADAWYSSTPQPGFAHKWLARADNNSIPLDFQGGNDRTLPGLELHQSYAFYQEGYVPDGVFDLPAGGCDTSCPFEI